MNAIRVPLEKFDLDGFINKTLKFLDYKADYPTLAITWVEAPGRYPNDETDENWDFRSKLLCEPVYLFFPFALPDMEGSFDCADGQSYRVTAKDYYGEDEEWDDEEGYDDDDEEFSIEDIIGYLIRFIDGVFDINLAICPLSGGFPPPTVDLLDEKHFLEKKLIDFISGFVSADTEIRGESSQSPFNLERFRITKQEAGSRNGL
ncbi:MAG: hypothetical protein V1792_09660 [Pseudomonadota bacterium]